MKKKHLHTSHPAIIKRLNRAKGHLQSVIKMIEDQRPCIELAGQLHAVEKAIAQAKKTLVQDHLDHCLEHASRPLKGEQRLALDEFKEITKFL